MSGILVYVRTAVIIILTSNQLLYSQVSNETGFKIVCENEFESVNIVRDGVYFSHVIGNHRNSYRNRFMNLTNNQLSETSLLYYSNFKDFTTKRTYSIKNGKMVKTICRFKDVDVRCDEEVLDKDIDKIEILTGSNIETYAVKHSNLIINNNKWAMRAANEYTDKEYIFIDGDGIEPLKIDVTLNNQVVKDIHNISIDWYLHSFYSFGNVDYVVIHSKPGHIGEVLCVYEIYEGKVSQIIYDVNEPKAESVGKYISRTAHVLPNSQDILILKETSRQPKYELTLFSRSQGKKQLLWRANLNNFLDITTVTEVNDKIVIGGTSKDGGYLGFHNPHIKVLNRSTGKVIQEYYIPSKNATIRSIARSNTSKRTSPSGKSIADYASGDLIIVCGYYKGIREAFIEKKSEGLIIRDYLNDDGTFQNGLWVTSKNVEPVR